jgi:hypothetical protein
VQALPALAQARVAAGEPRLDRLRREPEALGDRGGAEVLEVAQQDHGAERLLELEREASELAATLGALDDVRGRRHCAARLHESLVSAPAASGPLLLRRAAPQHRSEEAPRRVGSATAPEQRGQPRVLDDVLGLVHVAHEVPGETPHPAGVVEQGLELVRGGHGRQLSPPSVGSLPQSGVFLAGRLASLFGRWPTTPSSPGPRRALSSDPISWSSFPSEPRSPTARTSRSTRT